MKTSANFALSYPESGDHTRTWEYWQTLATQVDDLLSGKSGPAPYVFANDVTVGKGTDATERMLKVARLSGAVALESRHRVFPSGSGGGQGTVVSNEIWENGAEVAQFWYRRDGCLFTKSGGAAGVSRPLPFAMATGFVNVPVGNVNVGSADWVFPTATRFTVAPLVMATSTNNSWFPTITGYSAPNDVLKVSVTCRSYNGTNGAAGLNIGVHLVAFQMAPAAAAG